MKTLYTGESTWLRSQIESFNPNVPMQEAWLPPSSWYCSKEFYELEQQTVFKNNWLIAARSDQLEAHGQYVSGIIGGEPYVIVRAQSGELNAFYNVCRHHAAEVALGEGCLQKFQCPYHGWTYDLDGKLLSAPDLGAVKCFDRDHFGLVPLHVKQWGPLVFISRAEQPSDLDRDLADLRSALDATDFEALKFVDRRSYVVECNWKVFVDNYLDGGYHVPHLHKGLSDQLNLTTYTTDIFERFSIQATAGKAAAYQTSEAHKGGAKKSSNRKDATPHEQGQDFAERLGDKALYAWIYPTLMINRYGSIMDTNWVLPMGHDRTLVHIDYYFENTSGAEAEEFIRKSISASDVVQQEDIRISESVQRGVSSTSYDKGRYGAKEIAEHHFHRLLFADFAPTR